MLQTDLIAPIPELIARHAGERGSKVAFEDVRGSITYGELAVRTANLAGHFADLGLRSGETVAIFLPNCVTWVETCCSIARAGAVSVPISYDATESEVVYRLQDAACRMVITTGERAEFVQSLRRQCPDLLNVVLVQENGASTNGLGYEKLATTTAASPPRDSMPVHEPAFIIYTSGTTGRAKGVLLSTHSMLWITGACWGPIATLSDSDTVLSPLPLFHSYALNFSVLSVLAVGASEFIMEKFSTSEALRLLGTGRFTLFPGVPTMFHYLLEAARDKAAVELTGVRLAISAGAIMPASLNREFEARFGIKLLDGYGITETSTMVTMNWPSGGRVLGSCGLPIPGLCVRIVDGEGRDVEAGGEGELIVRGPNVMIGYHNKPDETATALRDGWYHTGDLAKCDENGFLTITGRLKELIIRGGQNIAPAEIEEVVSGHALVVDCAVVGVPHQHLGEVPALFVVSRAGSCDGEAILTHCRKHLSSYKVPETVSFVSEIPRTGSGKIMRFKLRTYFDSPARGK
ncbi:class I adenylate-forming enzyme family protein [Bradyrhizobium sp. PRIMUS42]|uniref:class I adenylate-forming enzyme family protein n=1 Tax=Bradyrhizobium sp. PRIMUS42 TaxID=2908926 RepID=UPI001FF0EB94|nr:class I adenylate-forming enzyme family protein [Bradyrhizobium sp. PRIMUS42]MCJ9728632.1 acyl--CoA ligase [Bradyrhizobium sp. PRIMUS42]